MKMIEVSSLKKPDGMVNLALNINELTQPIHDARQAEPLQKRPVVASAQLQVLDVNGMRLWPRHGPKCTFQKRKSRSASMSVLMRLPLAHSSWSRMLCRLGASPYLSDSMPCMAIFKIVWCCQSCIMFLKMVKSEPLPKCTTRRVSWAS